MGYRIRQWISLQFKAEVSDPLDRVSAVCYPLNPLARTFPQVKNHFFEHATEMVPLTDLRVRIVSGAA